MARVPIAQNRVQQADPSFTPLRAADFGSGSQQIGQAAQGLAGAIGDRAKLQEDINARYDEARAKDLDTQYSQAARPLLERYSAQQGVNALNARAGTEAALKDLHKGFLEKAQSPREKAMLQGVLDRRLDQDLSGVGRYAVEQEKVYSRGVSIARQTEAAQDARRFADDPEAFETHLETGLSEIRSRGAREGWGADVTRAEEAEYKSNVYAGVAADKAITDSAAAQKWLVEHGDKIDPEKAAQLEKSLEPALREQRANEEALRIRGIAAPPAPLIGKTIEDTAKAAIPGIVVTSRARTPAHNAEVGGKPNSYHLTGQARDFVPPKGMGMASLASSIKASLPGYQIINEGDHVHVEPVRRGAPQNTPDTPDLASQLAHVDTMNLPYKDSEALKQSLTRMAATDRMLLSQREGDAYDEATRRLNALGDGYTSPTQLGQAFYNASPEQQRTLIGIAKANRSPDAVKTDLGTLDALYQIEARNPKAFAGLDPWKYRAQLSTGDFRALLKRQADAVGKDGKVTPIAIDRGRLYTVSHDALAAAGVSTGSSKSAQEDAPRRLQFLDRMSEMQSTWMAANPGKKPDDQQIRAWAGALLIETKGGLTFEAAPDKLVASLNPALVGSIDASLKRAGLGVTNENRAAFYRRAWATNRLKRNP